MWLAAIAAAAVVTTAWALTGTPFEGADGNLVTQAGIDWDSFAASSMLHVGTDLPSGQMDDSFSGKEDDPAPEVTFGSIPGNKSDLLRFYVVHETLETGGVERDFLYLGWVRSNTLGSANMDFEFNQSKVLTANGVTPVRTAGDLLITFGFSGGGNQVELGMSRWTETGACEAAPEPPCWGPVAPLTGSAEGAVNLQPVLDPIAGVTLPEQTFGEAVIDLTGADIFDRDTCRTFGHAYVKSRSSDSFTSSLKDFISPRDVSVSNCATVTIRKDAIPDDAQDFTFHAQGGLTPATFMLDDDGNGANALPSSRTWEGKPNGDATVTEAAAAGWDLQGISCSGDATPVLDGQGRLTGEVTMSLAKGTTVDCKFTNTKRGRILIDEVTVPAGEAQPFAFHLTGGPDAVTQAPVLADASPPHDSGVLRPGTYAVWQEDPGDAWDLTSAVCSDGSSPGQVVLDPGETVICTFTNTKRGQILVDLVVTPSGDPQPFGFLLTGGPSALNQAFQLKDQDPPHASGYALAGGGYAAAASSVPAGYYFTSASCSDGSPVSGIQLSPGETVLCTFRYVKGGRLTVDKITTPDGDPASFNFSLTGGPSALNQGVSLRHADPPYVTGWLKPGAGYRITETIAAGWDLTQLSCTSGNGTSSISIVGADPAPGLQPGDNAALVDLGAGDDVTCAFTNSKRGKVVVVKDAIPDDPQDFFFSITGPATTESFVLDDDGDPVDSPGTGRQPVSRTFDQLRTGAYVVTQADPGPAWDAVSVVCTDSQGRNIGSTSTSPRTASFSLPPGETITCVFTDVKRGLMIVEKLVAHEPVPGAPFNPWQFPFEFRPSWGGTFWLKHGERHESPLLRGGSTASVTESTPPKWSATSRCVYPDGHVEFGGATARATIPPGGTVVCTFINELTMHPGSSGYWRNWDNHYSGSELQKILAEACDGWPFYTSFFEGGQLVEDAISIFDSIYSGSNTQDRRVLQELTSLMMNLAVSSSDDPEIRALQGNDDVCLDCIIDVSGIPGAQAFIDEWNRSITFGSLTVGDVIAVAEAVWSGDISTGSWSFDPLTNSEKVLLTNLLEAINQGTILTVDPSNYPDRIGCVQLAGLPEATEGLYYSATVQISDDGVPFAELIGDLPPGLELDPYTLEISGVPGYVGPLPATYTFSLMISIPGGGLSETREFSITVNPWPRITSLYCQDATVGVPYAEALEASGGAAPRTWSIASGGLPDGLTLDPLSGMIHGTPTGAGMTQATMYGFQVDLVDANGARTSAPMSIYVLPAGAAACTPPPPVPTQAPELSLYQWGGVTYLYWTSVPYATGYDVVRGDLVGLAATGGDFAQATSGCMGQNVTTMPLTDSATPALGGGYWFLLRARNCGGVGSFDTGGVSQSSSLDAMIATSGQSCD